MEICQGCNNIMTKCHDVVYGPRCIHEVVSYINKNPDYCEDIVVKKIFINTYNHDLALDIFREDGKDIKSDTWIYLPHCMQDNSYSYAIYWYGDNYERIYGDNDSNWGGMIGWCWCGLSLLDYVDVELSSN